MKLHILILAGTRGELVKAQPILRSTTEAGLSVRIVETDQGAFWSNDSITSAFNEKDIGEPYPSGLLTGCNRLEQQILHQIHITSTDSVLCIGDTTTAFAAALAAASARCPLIHVESGMRSTDIHQAFPEEIFRRIIDDIAEIHFCSHEWDLRNLLKSRSAFHYQPRVAKSPVYDQMIYHGIANEVFYVKPLLVVHVHRRELSTQKYINLLGYLDSIGNKFPDIVVLVIMNRRFRHVHQHSFRWPHLRFHQPICHKEFLRLLCQSIITISDSGTLQEECAVLGIPLLVYRDTTERPYLIDGHRSILVGCDESGANWTISAILEARLDSVGNSRRVINTLYGGAESIAVSLSALWKR